MSLKADWRVAVSGLSVTSIDDLILYHFPQHAVGYLWRNCTAAHFNHSIVVVSDGTDRLNSTARTASCRARAEKPMHVANMFFASVICFV